MIRPLRPSIPLPRPVFLTLACLAVALRILIPPGFMAAAPTNDLPFPIVLCSTQGAITVAAGQPIPSHGDTEPGSAHDSPCVFAGAAATPPPASIDAPEPALLAAQAPASGLVLGLAPGRGLAAPPPPARGPPAPLI